MKVTKESLQKALSNATSLTQAYGSSHPLAQRANAHFQSLKKSFDEGSQKMGTETTKAPLLKAWESDASDGASAAQDGKDHHDDMADKHRQAAIAAGESSLGQAHHEAAYDHQGAAGLYTTAKDHFESGRMKDGSDRLRDAMAHTEALKGKASHPPVD